MTHQQFMRIVRDEITFDEWRMIEDVFKYHPVIKKATAADIQYLYQKFGLQLFYDMRNTAQRARELQYKIDEAKGLAEEYERLYNNLCPRR